MPIAHHNASAPFVYFDVVYADGVMSRNRRVPSYELDGGNELIIAAAAIEQQDRKIAAQSHRTRGSIVSIERSQKQGPQ
jgi:hypothetical protein